MAGMNRREAIAGLAAMSVGGEGETKAATGDFAGGPKVFVSAEIPFARQPNGNDRRVVLKGALVTGELLRVHESHVPAGAEEPKLHVIHHSELIFVVEGDIEFVREGAVQKATAGDIVYVAYGTNHFIRNAGKGVAKYKVLSVGGDVKA